MKLTVQLFATLKDFAGSDQVSIELPDNATIADVRDAVSSHNERLAQALPSAIAAVNHEYVHNDHPVTASDEIAFFPPVSGGSSYPEITILADQPIDLNDLTQKIVTPDVGAIALFSGYVRGVTHGADSDIQTSFLEYEAYAPMAEAKMQQVINEIREKWPLVLGVAVVQRIGHLNVGEPTVLIACASGHRDQGCFEAARYGIDRLKEIVPVWKKEVSPDGEAWVEGSYMPNPRDD
ncbi:MAG: molybdopterin converting factor subunit 1 [Chloroflexi bacterium]|nr:molybdopterin converting factor subunit 1 [Chloroflexota bacterium]